MGSDELAANLFRITQTESKLKKDNVCGEGNAIDTHYEVGKKVKVNRSWLSQCLQNRIF